MTRRISSTPLGAVLRGAVAGMAGCATMDAWFAAVGTRMPPPRKGAFKPAEKLQVAEMPPETIARRVVAGVAKRGTLEGAAKRRAGRVVHYLYGASWGALYGVIAESVPGVGRLPGAFAWGTVVWTASDHLMVPLLRLGPWPSGVTPKGHAFWLATHFAWASGMGSAWLALRPKPPVRPGLVEAASAAVVLARAALPWRKRTVARLAWKAARPLFGRRRAAGLPLFA